MPHRDDEFVGHMFAGDPRSNLTNAFGLAEADSMLLTIPLSHSYGIDVGLESKGNTLPSMVDELVARHEKDPLTRSE